VFLRILREFEEANKELWLFLMMFGIVARLNYVVASDRMMVGFYVLPTVFSAYHYAHPVPLTYVFKKTAGGSGGTQL